MTDAAATLDEFREEFEFYDTRLDRIEALIHFGAKLEPMPEALKTDATLVPGCEAKVWAYPAPNEDGTLHFFADSTAGTTKGIIALVLAVVQDRSPEEILDVNIEEALKPFDVQRYITSKRTSGVPNMIALIRETAARYAH